MTAMARALRLISSLLLGLGLISCGDLTRPFEHHPGSDPNPLLEPGFAFDLGIDPVLGATPTMGRSLAQAVVRELEAFEIAATADPARSGRYLLEGRAEPNPDDSGSPYIQVIHWTLRDPRGGIVGDFSQGVKGDREYWLDEHPGLVQVIGRVAAEAVAGILEEDRAARPSAARRPGGGLLVRPVQGAPGDGDEALTRAVRLAMITAGRSLVEDPGEASYVVEGTVAVDPPAEGRQRVTVVWTVRSGDGGVIGRATQENTVPEHSLDGEWGQMAVLVVAAALEGIEGMMDAYDQSLEDLAGTLTTAPPPALEIPEGLPAAPLPGSP